jgi:hypothetical protein
MYLDTCIPDLSAQDSSSVRLTDTTDNCVSLYKPYKIVRNDPDFLDLQVDEIYRRVRAAVCDAATEILDSATSCEQEIDTISNCSWDSLLINKRGVWIKDLDSADLPSLRFYERSGAGTNYLEFKPRDMDSSHLLRWPKHNGDETRGRVYSSGKFNEFHFDEMAVDSGGQLFFFPRSLFESIFTDTIHPHYNFMDANQDYVFAGGVNLVLLSLRNAGLDEIHHITDNVVFDSGADLFMYNTAHNEYFELVVASTPDESMIYTTEGDSTPQAWTGASAHYYLQLEDVNNDDVYNMNHYPMTGLTQAGRYIINSGVTSLAVTFALGDASLSSECHACGHKYFAREQYSLSFLWFDSIVPGYPTGLSDLAISAKTDSSFTLTFVADTVKRTLEWIAHGYYKYMLP